MCMNQYGKYDRENDRFCIQLCKDYITVQLITRSTIGWKK